MAPKKRVIVAMSGGVDSSTAAVLLHKQGYEVIGITLKLPNMDGAGEKNCCGITGFNDAHSIAIKWDFAHYGLNHEKEFRKSVISYFINEYCEGRTPNPCIKCNEEIKFGTLLNIAKDLNAEYVATGHYAQVEYSEKQKRYLLKKGKDKHKDQSYFLFSLTQDQLAHALFPLGGFTKAEVRNLAREFGLSVHDKPGSQDICFTADDDYQEFIRAYVSKDLYLPGPIVDKNNTCVGEHQGIVFYTLGQRKGIGAHSRPMYVIGIEKDTNTVIIGDKEDLLKKEIYVNHAKIRYTPHESAAVVFSGNNGSCRVEFKAPQRAAAPGQAIVFYNNDFVIGGGWINGCKS
jgi:tRNA-specific 2-thiouridylase